MRLTKLTLCLAAAFIALAHLAAVVGAGTVPLIYDLDWNGPETSIVEECSLQRGCFAFPIRGTIAVTLDPERPYLQNIDSDILVPPLFPGPASALGWQHLDYHIGEYLSDDLDADVSMRFFPNPLIDASFPLFELFVDLTDGRSMLTLIGGVEGIAASPLETDVISFSVSGRVIPEPTTSALMLIAGTAISASRRRRFSIERPQLDTLTSVLRIVALHQPASKEHSSIASLWILVQLYLNGKPTGNNAPNSRATGHSSGRRSGLI